MSEEPDMAALAKRARDAWARVDELIPTTAEPLPPHGDRPPWPGTDEERQEALREALEADAARNAARNLEPHRVRPEIRIGARAISDAEWWFGSNESKKFSLPVGEQHAVPEGSTTSLCGISNLVVSPTRSWDTANAARMCDTCAKLSR